MAAPQARQRNSLALAIAASLCVFAGASQATQYTGSQYVGEGESLLMSRGDSLVYVGPGVALRVNGANAVMIGRQSSFQIGGTPTSIAGGLRALNGGRIELEQGTLVTNLTGQRVYDSLLAQGKDGAGVTSKIRLSDVDISAGYNQSGHGAFEAREGGSVHFTGGRISGGKRDDFFGLFTVNGADSEIRAVRTRISLVGNSGLGVADRGKLTLQSMEISNTDGFLNMLVTGAGSEISSTDATLRNGRYDVIAGAHADITNGRVENDRESAFRVMGNTDAISSVSVEKGRYSTKAGYLVEIDHDGHFAANDASFVTQDTWAALFTGSNTAELTLKKSTVQTSGKDRAHGVHVYGGTATLDQVKVETRGNAAYGLRGSQGSETNQSLLTVRNSQVDVLGTGGAALYVEGDKVEALLEQTTLNATQADAHGMVQVDRAKLTVNETNVNVSGAGASAYLSRVTAGGKGGNSATMNAAILRAPAGPLLWLQGDRHALTLSQSRLSAGEYPSKIGELLRVSDTALPNNQTLAAGLITFDAADTELVGDVRVESQTADVRLHLTGASKLLGALPSSASGQVAELHLLDTSSWEVSRNSALGYLNVRGLVEFAAPATAADFKHLQVTGNADLEGGVLEFNTQLGGDQSPTDRIQVQGDIYGTGSVRVNNVNGAGEPTGEGIRLLQVDGESNATLSLDGRVVAGAYEYALHKGSVSAPDDGDWYLRSSLPPPVTPDDPVKPADPTQPADPATPGNPNQPVDPAPPAMPPVPSEPLWRPEVAAYQANQFAAISLFSHNLHDRLGEPDFAERQRGGSGGHAWVRSQRQQRDTRSADAQLAVSSDSSLLQACAELTRWEHGNRRAHLGLMAGAGQAHSHVGSTLTGYRAKSKLSGTSVGVYGTWYANAANSGGLYLDGWLQHARFNNQVLGEGLPAVEYGARSWTASLEAGYAWNGWTTARARVGRWSHSCNTCTCGTRLIPCARPMVHALMPAPAPASIAAWVCACTRKAWTGKRCVCSPIWRCIASTTRRGVACCSATWQCRKARHAAWTPCRPVQMQNWVVAGPRVASSACAMARASTAKSLAKSGWATGGEPSATIPGGCWRRLRPRPSAKRAGRGRSPVRSGTAD